MERIDWSNKEQVEELKKEKEDLLAMVKFNGLFLSFASEELRADKELVLAAVSESGYALQYASEELRSDRDIVIEAVKQDGDALQCASVELQNDPELIKLAQGESDKEHSSSEISEALEDELREGEVQEAYEETIEGVKGESEKTGERPQDQLGTE